MSTYINLADAKTHLRVDFSDDDTYIQSLCDLVEEVVLNEIKGSMPGEGTVTTDGTVALVGNESNFLDYLVGDTITVSGETVRTIATITDDTHLTVTLAFSTTDSDLTYIMHEGLPLTGGTTLPLALKHAMLLMVGHFYLIREPVIVGVNTGKVPYAFDFLIAPFKNYTIS